METDMDDRPCFDPASREAVLDAIRSALAAEPGIRWAYVFGSLGRGEPFRDADVAVAVEPGGLSTWRSLGRLSRTLARATGLEGLEVDVFDVRRCPLPMVSEILRDGVVVTDSTPVERRLWECEVTWRWLDFRHVWEARERIGTASGS
jgi:predicted nucleotidyltransferase